MSFGGAFELSLVMPLSWVPLVADYSSRAKSARIAFLAPSVGYCLGSVWMYCLGIALALVLDSKLYMHFLEMIGAFFAPLSAILFSDYFLMRNDSRNRPVDITGLASLLAGIASHSAFSYWNSPLGPTLSCLLFTLALHVTLRRLSAARLPVPGVE